MHFLVFFFVRVSTVRIFVHSSIDLAFIGCNGIETHIDDCVSDCQSDTWELIGDPITPYAIECFQNGCVNLFLLFLIKKKNKEERKEKKIESPDEFDFDFDSIVVLLYSKKNT